MKIAVFSDIHSNLPAFETCLSYIRSHPVDGIIFLGDNVSDCPNPQAILQVIRQLDNRYPTWHIKGNREQYFVDHADGAKDGWCKSSYQGSLLYTYEHLTKEDLRTFRGYEGSRCIRIPGTAPLTIAHGSPASLRELMYPGRENTKRHMGFMDSEYLLCGHTHRQGYYDCNGRVFINPGSIGVSIGKPACACFAVLEWNGAKWVCGLLELPFDLRRLKREFYNSSLMKKAGVWPKCIIKSLETGINIGPICANEAHHLADKEAPGTAVTERHWRMAAKKLGID